LDAQGEEKSEEKNLNEKVGEALASKVKEEEAAAAEVDEGEEGENIPKGQTIDGRAA